VPYFLGEPLPYYVGSSASALLIFKRRAHRGSVLVVI
jgi:hypothetical protein